MHKFCLTLCVGLLLLTAGSCQPPSALGGTRTTEGTPSVATPLIYLSEGGKSLAARGEYAEAGKLFERGYSEAVLSGSRGDELLFLTYLANVANAQHRFRSAIEGYIRARSIAEEREDWGMLVVIEGNIAGLYLAQGATEEAGQAARRAEEALTLAGDVPQLAAIRLVQAKVRASAGDSDGAIGLLRQAVAAADEVGDENTLCRALDVLGYQLLVADRVDEAERVVVEAFRRRLMFDPPVPDVSYLNLALVRLRQGYAEDAEALVNQSFAAMGTRARMAQIWAPYLARAQTRMAEGEIEGAYRDLEEALDHARRLRLALLPTHSVRAGARAGLDEVYSTFIEVAARLHFDSGGLEHARRAFEVSEQHRAIALRESLDEASELRERLPLEYWELLDELNASAGLLSRDPSAAVQQRLARLETRLAELETRAVGSSGETSPLLSTAALRPVSVEMVQRALGDSEALFGFQLGEETSYLWSLTRGRFEMYRLPAGAEIDARARSFRDAVQRSLMEETTERGAALYETLFGPVSEEAIRKPDWILLPDGALFDIPFAALTAPPEQGREEFLIERHSLRVLPSAAMLLDTTREAWNGPFVAIGDPIYNAADPRWQSGYGRRPRPILQGIPAASSELNRLVGSAREAGACARAYGGNDSPIMLLGDGASVSGLRAALALHPSVIHLATHVVPSPDRGGEGNIALSLSADGATELLGTDTVASWEANPALVVMSGCRSGGGTVLPGEGLLGLTRAWLRAGARNVAATLWPTPDTGGELLRALYRHLSDEPTALVAPAKALQRAQIEILRSRQWGARPDHWAAYFMVSRE